MIVALLSWYDEQPDWLTRYVEGLATAQVVALVALDGAYALYPDATPRSPQHNHDALVAACHTHGIDLTIRQPATVWHGGEIQKRTHLFRLADAISTPSEDWYLVLDADEHITSAPYQLPDLLHLQDHDVGMLALTNQWEATGASAQDKTTLERRLYRSAHGITVQGNHFTYVHPDGRRLWGTATRRTRDTLAPAFQLPDLAVTHHTRHRAPERRAASGRYYNARRHARIEHDVH